ncbi:3'-5' exonuclease [Linum perenne]
MYLNWTTAEMRTNIIAFFRTLPAAGTSSQLRKRYTSCSSSSRRKRMYSSSGSSKFSSSSSPFPSVPDLDEPLTEQDLEAIDVIEATFRSSTPSSTSASSIKQQDSTGEDDRTPKRPCRRLPSSVLDICKPFPLSPCQGALPSKAAVMQLCADVGQCYVMHIIHSGITPSLRLLLQDYTVIKVGVGIGNDSTKVFKDYNVSVQAVEDLSYLANQKLGGQPKNWSLKALAETLVSKELPKPKKVRLGNWEVKFLTKQQIQYAATDAFASWQLYQVLKELADTKNCTDETSEGVEVMPPP